jgi:hypothetical protein
MRPVIQFAILLLIAVPVEARARSAPSPDADPHIQQLVASVSEQRLRQLDTTLVSFGTRETIAEGSRSLVRRQRRWTHLRRPRAPMSTRRPA